MGPEGRRLSVEVVPEDFYGDIHSTLPHSIYRGLEQGDSDLVEVFGIEEPNRVITESEIIGPGIVVEDFMISGSRYGGEAIIGQSISAREKNYSYRKEVVQVESFQYRLKNFHRDAYERLAGSYVVAVDNDPEEVRDREVELMNQLLEHGRTELELLVREIDARDREVDMEYMAAD